MSEFFSPYDADRPLMLKCSCGRDHTVADRHAEVSADAAAATLRQRVDEIRGRYPSEDDLIRDLERIGLSEGELDKAVERDLRVEGVLEKVASAAEPVSAVDAEIYYRLHPEAFDRPEARRLRHTTPLSVGTSEAQQEVLRAGSGQFEAAERRDKERKVHQSGGVCGVRVASKVCLRLFAELHECVWCETGEEGGAPQRLKGRNGGGVVEEV